MPRGRKYAQNELDYRRSPKGRAVKGLARITTQCNNPYSAMYAKVAVRMTRDEWLKWAIPAYEKWMKANPGVSPSVVRKNNTGNFRIGNLEIVSTAESHRRSQQFFKAKDGMKICVGCRKKMPIEAFYVDRSHKDGRRAECRSCCNARQLQYRIKKKAKKVEDTAGIEPATTGRPLTG